jgi:hypothetical protein
MTLPVPPIIVRDQGFIHLIADGHENSVGFDVEPVGSGQMRKKNDVVALL